MNVVKVAVLGCGGWMGRTHVMAYQSFSHFFTSLQAKVEVVYFVDGFESALEPVKESFPNAKISTEWRDAIEDPDVDLIAICLPDRLHYEVAKAALEAGKHVYCEKSLTENAREAAELNELAKRKKLITRVGHGFMRNPAHDLVGDYRKW